MEVLPMTQPPAVQGVASADPPTVAAADRRAISEDWVATLIGLILVALVLAGVLTDAIIP